MKITNTALIATLMMTPTLVLAQTGAVTTSINADVMLNDDVNLQAENQNNVSASDDMIYAESNTESNVEADTKPMMEITTTAISDLGAEVEANLDAMVDSATEIIVDVDAEIQAGAETMEDKMEAMAEEGAEIMHTMETNLTVESETEANVDEDANVFVKVWVSIKSFFGFGN